MPLISIASVVEESNLKKTEGNWIVHVHVKMAIKTGMVVICMYFCAEVGADNIMPVTDLMNPSASSPMEPSTDIQNMPVGEVSDATDGGRSTAGHLASRPSLSSAAGAETSVDNDAKVQFPQPSQALLPGIFSWLSVI